MFSRPVAPPIETFPDGSRKTPGAFWMTSPNVRPLGSLSVKSWSKVAPMRVLPTSTVGAFPVMT